MSIIPLNKGLFQPLSSNGDGTGTIHTNIVGGTLGTPLEYYIQPPEGESYILNRLNIQVIDGAFTTATNYGAIVGGLTNGIIVCTENDVGIIVEYTDNIPIKRTHDWSYLAGVDATTIGGAGADALLIRWTFERSYDKIILNGDKNEKFVIGVRDDLSALTDQVFIVQGYKRNNKIESNIGK